MCKSKCVRAWTCCVRVRMYVVKNPCEQYHSKSRTAREQCTEDNQYISARSVIDNSVKYPSGIFIFHDR